VVARHGLEFRAVGPDFGDWFAELGRRAIAERCVDADHATVLRCSSG
jgi:hypothetical protein